MKRAYRALVRLERTKLRAVWLVVAAALVFAFVTPLLLAFLLWAAALALHDGLGVEGVGDPPKIGELLTATNVGLLFLLALFVLAISHRVRDALARLFPVSWWLPVFGFWRMPMMRVYLVLGRLERMKLRGFWPFVPPLVFALVTPLMLALFLWAAALGLRDGLGVEGVGDPRTISDLFTARNVGLLFLLALFVNWISHTRRRIVVESFVDYTTDEGKAVSGLSTLLVTELGRIRELYSQVSELSIPMAVGVEQHGGFDRARDPAAFLTVSADDPSSVLEGAVASDATIGAGPVKLPLGWLLAFINRVTRGPRVLGTVHLTEAGGGPTITAQLVGTDASGTWRVDHEDEPESAAQRKAFLDSMVRVLACRMYAQLTLGGTVRSRAVWFFNEYLELYGNSQRTPRDRARFLKQAQGKLMLAVAEDERFDLAYYNLGVIYTHLANTERNADPQAYDVTSRANLPRRRLDRARQEAARVAFTRATEKNADRWEAYYALAVTRFNPIRTEVAIGGAKPRKETEQLRQVIALCDQAVQVASRQGRSPAAAIDLRGMAQTRLAANLPAALQSHRMAVTLFWRELCEAERRTRAGRGRDGRAVVVARANAAAALSNLALSFERDARFGEASAESPLDARRRATLARAADVFGWAIAVAGRGSEQAAACHFERGVVFERLARPDRAADEYAHAGRIHTTNCEYPALRALALARAAARDGVAPPLAERWRSIADHESKHALHLLAGPFSVAVSLDPPDAVSKRVVATLDALANAAELLPGRSVERPERIKALREALDECFTRTSVTPGNLVTALKRLHRSYARDATARSSAEDSSADESSADESSDQSWELAQVELAQGRLYARAQRWGKAERAFTTLVERLSGTNTAELVEFGVYAEHARALRECGRYREALTAAAECVRRDPLNVDGRREAGRAHFALRQYNDARVSWEQALWLSPSDPYLHYELAMCHRRIAGTKRDTPEHEQEMEKAATQFREAQELFDGEDLDGEAWMRVWLGRIAFERGDVAAAVRHLGGAEHGTARAAAALLLGEAQLELDKRVTAEQAFQRCRRAVAANHIAYLVGRDTIDAGWGDELSRPGVAARLLRGFALARFLSGGKRQDLARVHRGLRLVRLALRYAGRVERDDERDLVTTMCLEAQIRLFHDGDQPTAALDSLSRRLRFDAAPILLRLESHLESVLDAVTVDDDPTQMRWPFGPAPRRRRRP